MTHGEISLREYFERIVDGLDKRIDERFQSQEAHFNISLTAQQRATDIAFASSEKAIVKAEDAQRAYNLTHNDLLRKNELMMPRTEVLTMFKAFEEKLFTHNESNERRWGTLDKEIASLRESRSEGGGKTIGIDRAWGYLVGFVGLMLALAALLWGR